MALLTGGCDGFRADAPAPFEEYVSGDYRPPIHAPAVAAPEALRASWRVQMLQTHPRPFKNPRWVKVAFDAAGEIEMPPNSSFRCLYNPIKIRATSDESMKRVAVWHVAREVWCSNDRWRTHAATGLMLRYDGAGKPAGGMKDQAELVLFENIEGKPTTISILLRAD